MIPCFSCAYEVCCRCVKTFLTSTPTEPACMNCRHPWSREFLDAHLSRSWLEGDLKLHRQSILFDRERSLLPATQPDVEIELQKRAYAANRPLLLEKVETATGDELAHLNKQIQDEYNYILSGPAAIAAKQQSATIAACPSTSCRGFLSETYKCGTCATQFCSDCRERKQADHVCDPALVATIAAIIADSRPCPRCSTAISKVSGCDQMYCTQCDTPFSYEKGTIVKGIIHNPHYFERLQKLKGTGQGQGQGCNGWPTLSAATLANNMLIGFLQTAVNVEQVDLADLLTVIDNRDLRVKYLLNELDEKKFKQLIQQRDRKLQRDLEIRAVLELFVITTLEYFHGTYMTDEANIHAFQLQIDTTINAPLKVIGERYANRVPQFEIDTGRIMYV